MDCEYYRTHYNVVSKTYNKFAEEFGKKIVKLRKERGMTQEELSLKSGIERSYMGAIERGEKNPTLKKIYNIALSLKIKASKLFEK